MAFNYSPKVITNGLVIYLDAANPRSYTSGSLVWNDLTRNNRVGTLTNGPTYNSANGGSIVFDGVNDYCAMDITPPGTDVTACFWFLATSIPSEGFLLVTPGNNQGMSIRSATGNTLTYWDGVSSAGATVLQTNVIYNAVFKRDSLGGKYIYLNSKIDFTGSASRTFSDNSFYIGYFANLSRNAFPGRIYNVQIYNRALSDSEIVYNYNALKGRFGL